MGTGNFIEISIPDSKHHPKGISSGSDVELFLIGTLLYSALVEGIAEPVQVGVTYIS